MRTASLLIAGLLIAAPAAAQTVQPGAKLTTPADYGKRGLVLGEGELRVDFAPRDFGLGFGGIGGRSKNQDLGGLRIGRNDDFTYDVERGLCETFGDACKGLERQGEETVLRLTFGAAYGITEDFEAGAMILPIYLAPDGDFGDIEVYGRYRFLTQEGLQIGAQLAIAIPTDTRFGLGLGLPVQLSLGAARIDTGLELELLIGDEADVDLDLPVALSFDIADGFFAGLRTGLFLPGFTDAAIPLMGHAGYTLVSGKEPFIDLVMTFGWPRFIWTGLGDSIDVDTFDLVLGARVFFSVQ